MRRQRHGFTTVIRDTYLTHMPLLSVALNYLSASKHALYDMTLVYTTEGTLLFPAARESATKYINPPHHSQVTVFNETRRTRNVTMKVSDAFKVYLFKMHLTALSPRSHVVE
jgi:hypothetical protein